MQQDNLKIYYEIEGTGEPLLLIHGLGASTKDWEYQVKFFKAHYQVITFDLRGHGKTAKPSTPYSIALFAEDTAKLIRTLSQQPVHVVGHSLGGMIAFQLALDFPELARSLVIINSAPAVIFSNKVLKWIFYSRVLKVKLFGMRPLANKIAKTAFPEPEQRKLRDLYVERWCQNDPVAYVNTVKAFYEWNVMNRLSTLQTHTLIMTADKDYTTVKFKEDYTKLIPHTEFVVIKDSRHLSIIDQPDAVNKALFDFLQHVK